MKTILVLISLLLMCGTANAMPINDNQHYIIAVIVWDNVTGLPEAGVPVTFQYVPHEMSNKFTFETAEDGSVVFDVANFDSVKNNRVITVVCKYGTKNAPVVYYTNESVWNATNQSYDVCQVYNWGTGITFNEPDEVTAIEAFAALGFAAIALGGGRYLLRRKKNTNHTGDIMTDETNETIDTRSKLVKDFGVRAAIALVAMTTYGIACIVAVYNGDMGLLDDIARVFTPVISVIVLFYFGGSMIRDGLAKK